MSFCPISPPRERKREKRRQWTNKRTIVVSTKNECLNHFPFNEFQQVVVLYIPFGGGGHSLSPLFTISLIHKFSIQMYGWLSVVGFILAECFCYCQSKFRVRVGLAWCLWLCVSNLTNTHSHFTKPNLTCLLIPGLWSNYNKNSNDKNNRSVYSHGIIMIFPVSVCTSVCKYVLVWCPSFFL